MDQGCREECALDPPSLVHSIVGGVIETGDGRARGHHELTLRSTVRDQSICGQNSESNMPISMLAWTFLIIIIIIIKSKR